MNYYYLFSENYRCIFVPIAKSASSSLKVWMFGLDDLRYQPDASGEGSRVVGSSYRYMEQRFPGYYKFTIVRNPFSRIVSCYLDKFVSSAFQDGVRVPRDVVSPAFRQNVEKFDRFERWVVESFGGTFEQGISFETFASAIETDWTSDFVKRVGVDPHWASQYGVGGFHELRYDRVCRLENIVDDMQEVGKDLGIPADRARVEERNSARAENRPVSAAYLGDIPAAELSRNPAYRAAHYRSFFRAPLVDLVEQKYRDDLTHFGYTFGSSCSG